MTSISGLSQNNITSSPYSLYGVGDPLSQNNTMGLSMGDLKYSMDQMFYLNSANPASYGALKAPTFSLGAMVNRTRTFNSETSQDNDNGTLRYFGLGIPVSKKMGMALGAKPFTSLGYGIQIDSDQEYPAALSTRYEGQGGMNIIYGGLGYTVIKDSLHTLRIGANANFYLGNNRQAALNRLDQSSGSGALNSMFTSNSLTKDFGFDIGLIYKVNVTEFLDLNENSEQALTLGGSFSPGTNLNTTFENFSGAYYATSNGGIIITDTLKHSIDTSTTYLPQHFGFGFNYKIYNRNAKYMWIVGLDYEQFNWSDLKQNNQSANLQDAKQYSFGIQFIPNASDTRGFLKLISYRVGMKYRDTRIEIVNHQLTDISGSAGFGIPLVRSKSVYPTSSTIDFGVEVGSRGTVNNGLIKEQYTNIYIGLSFSPNYWDRWFKKRKIN